MDRKAATLLEVLVVFAIVVLLIALSIPAIQMARQASRRASCSNKLRQIGLALHSYQEKHSHFPPHWTFGPGGDPDGKVAGPWNEKVHLLPHVGGNNLYNSLNLGLNWQHRANATVVSVSPGQYICPSDTNPRAVEGEGVSNYKACLGSGRYALGLDAEINGLRVGTEGPFSDGFFGLTFGLRPGDVLDGLSQTAAMSEMIHGADLDLAPGSSPPLGSLGVIYMIQVAPPTQRNLIERCKSLTPLSGARQKCAGRPWVGDVAYTHLQSPGNASCWGVGFPDQFSPITANSRHGRGVNVVFADGHVRFIGNDVDQEIWRALGSRNGSETIAQSF